MKNKSAQTQRVWTVSFSNGVAVVRCLRITPAGECRWCMRDGPGWGQRAAEETFGIDQFFPFESYVDINANVQRRDSRRCGRDTVLGCDPDRHYNRASARVCYPGTAEADDGAVCDELTSSAC